MSYPSSIDNLPNPTSGDNLNNPDHAGLHTSENGAIEALETKLGTGASTPSGTSALVANGTGSSEWRGLTTSDVSGLPTTLPPSGSAGGDLTGTYPNPTLAAVNTDVGTYGTASEVPAVTVNAKGLVTSAVDTSIQIAESQVTNLTSDLASKQDSLTLTTTGSSGAATLTGSTLNIPQYSGSGGSSPLTTKGDIYTYSTANARLPVGTDGQVLSANSSQTTGLEWIASGGTGTVTSVAVSGANGIGVSGSPITTTGTIDLSLGAITPSTVNGVTLSGTSSPSLAVTGTSSISGSNTGDQTIPTSLPPNGSAGGDLSGTYPNPTVAKINGTALSGLATGILKNTTSTGVPSIAGASDFPTLNQNTTGTAANVTGTVAVANGGTGATTLTGLVKGNGTSAMTAGVAGTDYQAPITLTTTGTSGAATFSGNTLNIPNYATGGGGTGITWNTITSNVTASSNNGYLCNSDTSINVTLPSTSNVGDIIEVVCIGAAPFSIIVNGSLTLQLGTLQITSAVGSLSGIGIGDAIKMVCTAASSIWMVVSSVGNFSN